MKIPPGALKTLPLSPTWTPVKVSSMHFTSTDKTETYHSASFWGIICGCCSVAKSCLILCDPMDCSMLGFPDHHYLLELAQPLSVESVMFSNHLILCCSLLLLPSMFPSIRAFSNVSALHIRWPKYWSFSFSPSNEYSELISFTIDWFDLSAVQGTLKESSPTPQFKSINSLALSLHYGPILTSVHDYWKTHSFDYKDAYFFLNVSKFSSVNMLYFYY